MKHCCSICILFVALLGTPSFGQNFRYTLYDGKDTPFESVNQTLEDHKGFVWIASDSGLYRFDGKNFQDFNSSLKSKHIHHFVRDEDTVYFSNDSGIFKLYYEDEQVTLDPYLNIGEGTEIGFTNALFLDAQKHLWASSSKGSVFKINRSNKEVSSYHLPSDIKARNTFLGEDNNQTLWALSPGYGLFYLDPTQNAFVKLPGFEDARHFCITNDYLYVVGSGIQGFSIVSKNTLKKQMEIHFGKSSIERIARDRDGTYFVASGQSLFTYSPGASTLKKVFGSNDPHRVEELPFSTINSIGFSEDQLRKGGKIWVGMRAGVGLLQTAFFSSVEGMPHDNILGVATGSQQKVLISQGSVFEVNTGQEHKVFNTIPEVRRATGISMRGNTRYYGAADGSLSVFKDRNKVQTYNLQTRGGGIFFTFPDSFGDLWFCQAPSDKPLQGVGKLQANGQLKFYDAKRGLDSRILVIREGGRSEIYAAGIGLESYLFKYNSAADIFEPKSLPLPDDVSTNFEVHDLSVDALGIVWMGSTDGLLKYDTETVKRIDLGPFTNNEIRAVQAVEDGGVWVATDTDGLLYRYPSGAYVQFDEDSGTPSKIAAYRCLSRDTNGTLWVGTAEGAVYSSMNRPEPLATALPRIEAVYVNKNSVALSGLSLSDRDAIQFKLATISYPIKGLQYQYKLVSDALSQEAIDDAPWSSAFQAPEVHLQNLTQGQYEFLVRAQQPGGHNWSPPVSMLLTVSKAWYATWWGISLILAIALIVFWYITYRWGRKKTKSLSAALSQKQLDLDHKHAQLAAKSDALTLREEELKSTGANLYMLNRLLDQIPKGQSWEEALPILKKLVQLPTPLDAFEIGFIKATEIHYRGYTRNEGQYFERKDEFNEKENLQSYALCGNVPLLISNFDMEAAQYIGTKKTKGYPSWIVIPFRQLEGTEAIFCAYAKAKGRFSRRDLTLVQVLVKYLSTTVRDVSK